MLVDVDTHERGGSEATAARTAPAYQTKAYASLADLADRRVAAIIKANGGDGAAARPATQETAKRAAPKPGAH
jgi:hypothetical protein